MAIRSTRSPLVLAGLISCIIGFASLVHAQSDKEILRQCSVSSGGDARLFGACVSNVWTAREIGDVLGSMGFGCGNEIRKFLSPCEPEPAPPELQFILAFDSGFIAGYEGNSLYYSPDGSNLRGGGNTERVYGPGQAVLDIIPYDTGVMTAFEQGGIYFSPDGRNLGGGGQTERRYVGQTVVSMTGRDGGIETCFSGGGCYFSPDGHNPGGGGQTVRVR
jgi:hypothetical protein